MTHDEDYCQTYNTESHVAVVPLWDHAHEKAELQVEIEEMKKEIAELKNIIDMQSHLLAQQPKRETQTTAEG